MKTVGAETDAERDALFDAFAKDFRARGKLAAAFVVPALLLLRAAASRAFEASGEVRVFFYAALVLVAARWLACMIAEPSPRWARWCALVVPAALVGASVGGFIWTSYRLVGPVQVLLMAVCATGLNSVACVSLGSNRAAYFGYMLPMLGALALRAFLSPHAELTGLFAPLVVVYMLGLSMMTIHVHASTTELTLLQLRLHGLAHHDGLTGLANRRFVTEYMSSAGPFAARARRSGDTGRRSLGVVIVDLDHFKRVNDRYGHDAGDAILRQFGRLLKRSVRSTDVVARWGGEEFVILCPDTDRTGLTTMVERIRRTTECRIFPIPSGPTLRVNCSIGFSAWSLSLEDSGVRAWEHILSVADAALGDAKESGRNRALGACPASGSTVTAQQAARAVDAANAKAVARNSR